jgi:hypothetical protein
LEYLWRGPLAHGIGDCRRRDGPHAGKRSRTAPVPAWQTIPSWAGVGTADHAIPPALQLAMAENAHAHITEVKAPYLSMISDPRCRDQLHSAGRPSHHLTVVLSGQQPGLPAGTTVPAGLAIGEEVLRLCPGRRPRRCRPPGDPVGGDGGVQASSLATGCASCSTGPRALAANRRARAGAGKLGEVRRLVRCSAPGSGTADWSRHPSAASGALAAGAGQTPPGRWGRYGEGMGLGNLGF